jgi:phosphohistidine phosphatase
MNLYFLRHAKAEPRGPQFPRDAKRPLCAEGEKTARRVAEGMVELDLSFDLIITSPFARALRTAEITAEVLETEKIWPSALLAADGDPAKLIAQINDNYASLENILLVGHEPYLSETISLLLTGEPGLPILLKKSGLAKLAVQDLRAGKCGVLEWLLTPRQLQRLSK